MPEPVQLTGRVLDDIGKPVPAARIVALSDCVSQWHPIDAVLSEASGFYKNARWVAADDEGRFAIRDGLKPGGPLSVSVVVDGFAPLRLPHEQLSRELPHDMGDLVLSRGHSISGFVLDEFGSPLSGVQILMALERGIPGCFQSFPGRGIPLASTDANGRFTASGLLPGRWVLLFDKQGFQVAEAQGNFFNDPAPDALSIKLVKGRSISGRVLQVPPQLSTAQLMVEARPIRRGVDYVKQYPSRGRPRRTLVQPDGTFQIEGINEEEFRPNVQPGIVQGCNVIGTTRHGSAEVWLVVGHATESGRRFLELPEFQSCRVESGTEDVEIPWLGLANFSARVVDESSAPVDDFKVEVRYETGFGPDRDPQEVSVPPGGRIELRDFAAWDSHLQYWQPPRKVYLWIRATGYEFREVEIQEHLRRGQHTEFGDIVLRSIPKTRVRVVNESGMPISGVELRLTERKSRWMSWAYECKQPVPGSWEWNLDYPCLISSTNDKGEALLSHVVEGEQMLSACHPDHAFQVLEFHPPQESNNLRDYENKAGPCTDKAFAETLIEMRLVAAGSIAIVVVEQTGQPAAWRTVFIESLASNEPKRDSHVRGYRFEAVTNGAGRATFARLKGRFLVGLKHPEEKRRPESRFFENERTIVEVDGNEVRVKLTAWPVYEVSGTICESDRPVIGATLNLISEYQCTQDGEYFHTTFKEFTSDQGAFRFRNVPPGEYLLHVNHDDRNMVNRRSIHVRQDMKSIDWLLDNNTVSGQLSDPDGSPIEYKRVLIKTETKGYCQGNTDGITYEDGRGNLEWFWSGPWIHETWTDQDGRFHFRGLVAGLEMTIHTSHEDLTEATVALAPLESGEQREDVQLVAERAGRIRLLNTAELPNVNEIPHRALLYPIDAEGTPSEPFADNLREKKLPNPHPIKSCSVGPWRIVIERAGKGDSWETVRKTDVTVVAGEMQEVNVVAIES